MRSEFIRAYSPIHSVHTRGVGVRGEECEGGGSEAWRLRALLHCVTIFGSVR